MVTDVRRFPAALYRLWKAMGSPCPRIARHVRYRIFGWIWPTHQDGQPIPLALDELDIAVIIVCHDYGKYLPECVESVLRQSLKAREILIVDDASSDSTQDIARGYERRGIGYLRGEWRSVCAARNAGAAETVSPLLVFMDADDILPRSYLRKCRKTMEDVRVGIAYGDIREFGRRRWIHRMPRFDRTKLVRDNFISSHAMMRRQAYEVAGGYREYHNAHEDWDLYRRIVSGPWTAKKVRTFVWYRIHDGNSLSAYMASNPSYALTANLHSTPVTIFTPFAGRTAILPRFAQALQQLKFDPAYIRLHWFNTSPDPSFESSLKEALLGMPFSRLTYTRAPLPGVFGHTPDSLIRGRVRNTRDAQYFYEMAVVYAYNTLLTTCDTELVLILEDDVIPSPSTLRQMLETLTPQASAVVAHYPCHLQGYSMVWTVGRDGSHTHVPERRSGIEEVGGSGFGCSLIRMADLREEPIRTSVRSLPPRWYDHIAFDRLRRRGPVLCNWDVEVEHVKTERFKESAPS
jgi:glycosyltransferase involved in cell wall biosynthesis